jgi:two-component system, cell cycle response regulator
VTLNSHPSRFGLLPLADRIRWSTSLRVGLAAAVMGFWIFLPQQRRTDGQGLFIVAVACGWAALLAVVAPRLGRRIAIAAVNLGLLLDGVGLAVALHAYGGVAGPIGVLMVLHVCGVSLLTSFRSGGKIAVWHGLMVLCVLQAEHAGLLTVKQPGPFPLASYVTFILLLGAAAMATSLYAAVNERELRRRRYDADMLRSLAVELEASNDLTEVTTALARLAVEDLLATRALVVIDPSPDEEGRGLGFVETRWPELPPDLIALRPAYSRGSVLSQSADEPVLTKDLDEQREAYLRSRLPDAQRLVVLPIPLGKAGRGRLVLDMGNRKRVEHRMLSTLVQATAHVGLALSRAQLVERLRLAAETDGLTGVANRKSFDLSLNRQTAHAQRSGEPFAVALVDLDFFKRINDTYGHQIGDDVLRAAAAALHATARDYDVVARYGGEEFGIILPGVHGQDAWETAERFRVAVRSCPAPVPVSCSIGIASSPPGGVPPAALLQVADQALYQAKERGRDRVEVGGFGGAMPGAPALHAPHDAPALHAPHDAPGLHAPHDAPALHAPYDTPAP